MEAKQIPLLETKNLEIGYAQKSIAKAIHLNIPKGKLIATIGINGSGKSTLLKTLIGQLQPKNGAIFLENKNIKELSAKQIAEQISIVLTHTHFSKNLSIQEFVALGRHPYTNWLGVLSAKDKQAITKALELIDLNDKAERKCSNLSDGQLQKVMLARALAQDTPLIVLDEPTTHLDMYHKVFVLKMLKDLTQKTGKTIVFASHEINLALQLCDEIILINKGRVIQDTPKQLIEDKHLERLFPKNLIRFDAQSSTFKIVE
ncbi:ABC transporter ATP-binding protein [Haloflavibacter putidus]|uniref:ABC transporter ATP-binding protein n=1 Tax=Haloflavibacter putidus TaxID=2576776 RepID=A0A507ZPC1_9FLAO|nr:ABC transporter ATP-binding protein [Haloflavibacter putidus]TQD39139.1 ABC transporter ATP-binding protein [Haloflavibacter putidus]